MAPTLRSGGSIPSTPTTTPRKTPHCTKCNRPRVGHPRQGCPYVDSHTGEPEAEQENITNALETMNIESLVPEKAGAGAKSTRRRSSVKPVVPDPSLASLSTTSNEIVDRLLMPGIMGEDTDEEGRLAKWQDVVSSTPTKANGKGKMSGRSTMPGTLNTPSSSFFQSTQDESSVKSHTEDPPASSTATTTVRAPRPLARSLSAEARELFLLRLDTTSTTPPATVYVLPKVDIPALQHAAVKLGFHSHTVEPALDLKERKIKGVDKGEEKETDNGWLILGRDEKAVQELYEGVKLGKVDGSTGKSAGKGAGRLSAAAGGMIMGAVATFTGLAYS